MQQDKYFIRLIREYYQSNISYLRKKYSNLSFKEIFELLEKQEKQVIELQNLILEMDDKKEEYRIIRLFCHQKYPMLSYRAFKNNLFAVDTSKEINKKICKTVEYLLTELKNRRLKWVQKTLF